MSYVEYLYMDDAEVAVVSYGCTGRSAKAAVKAARARGLKVGLVRLITIWPFQEQVISAVAEMPAFVASRDESGRRSQRDQASHPRQRRCESGQPP